MRNAVNSRWLLSLPKTEDTDLTLCAKDLTDCSLPGFDFLGSQVSGGSTGTTFLDLEPDRLIPEIINFNFLVDEDYANYIEVLKQAFKAFKTTGESYFDASITPLDTLGKDIGVEFQFRNARFTNVSSLDYDNNASNKFLKCVVGLKYESFALKVGDTLVIDTDNI